jgi:hypothetical protein
MREKISQLRERGLLLTVKIIDLILSTFYTEEEVQELERKYKGRT